MNIPVNQLEAITGLLDQLATSLPKTFTGSREGFIVVDVDAYLAVRDLFDRLYREFDAEVFRVCFEERLSNRSFHSGA